MSTLIGGTNKDSTSSRATAKEAFKLITRISRHIEDDCCCLYKAALLNIISAEDMGAGRHCRAQFNIRKHKVQRPGQDSTLQIVRTAPFQPGGCN
jgi:hypothetical protein